MTIMELLPETRHEDDAAPADRNRQALASSDLPCWGTLIVQREEVELDRHRLCLPYTTIGRGPKSDIRVDCSSVSFDHVALSKDDDHVYVIDLHSISDTFVNGRAVRKTQIKSGDVVSIGSLQLRLSLNASSVGESDADACEPDEPVGVLPADESEPLESNLVVIDQPDEEEPCVANRRTLDEAALLAAVQEAGRQNRSPVAVLIEEFGWNDVDLTAELGNVFSYSVTSAAELIEKELEFAHFSPSDARQRGCLVTAEEEGLAAFFWDPFDPDVRSWLEARVDEPLTWSLISRNDIEACISRYEQSLRAIDSAVESAGGAAGTEASLDDLSMASINRDTSPVVKLVRSTLFDALRANASDVHLESGTGTLDIRYRIDGVLVKVASVTGSEIAEQVVSRIKVMSELDIAERRIPQDGRFKCAYEGRPIDFRVSIMPSTFGEDAVLRVLDKQAITDQMSELSIGGLGFDDGIVESLRHLSRQPHGMLLVTGPTGSGKTTTLYAAISESNTGMGKIVTIEDPVEYQLPGVLQIPVNEKKGLTFARGLRSILRHDPDKIMVGEIRDSETAQIAVQSALTGHLVFTTVHANNVFDVLSRFEHMGVDVYSFVAALNGILAQRLIRLICPGCAGEYMPTAETIDATGVRFSELWTFDWRKGRGCGECRGTGYRGRKAVGELLVLDDEFREAIISRAPARELKELASKNNVQFIRAAALSLVRDGLTTIDEVNRVIAAS